MVQFNTRANEILLKLVYYGPGLSGKTTNLQALHAMCQESQRGEMFSVNTQEDRTLFFDLLPINLGYIYGNAIHLQIYTVPGQVQYDASRRVVLGGADGVVFVADSDEAKMQENVDSLSNLYHNLNANRLNIKQIPFVIQFNKRDLGHAMPVGVMNRRLNFRSVPYFEAVANKGVGVIDTFLAITRETVGYTFKKYHLDKKIKDFEEMLNLIDSNIRSSMRELPPPAEAEPEPLPPPEATVLRHSNVSITELQPGRVVEASELLENALKSNMETARLYSELKAVKENLEKKSEEMGLLYQQLDRANQDNLKTRKYLEGLVQNIGEAVISFSGDGRILTWNAAAERIFGYARPDIVGKPMSTLTPDHLLAEIDQALQLVSKGQVLRDIRTTRLRKGGVAFPASITYAPVLGPEDRVVACSALVRDMEGIKEETSPGLLQTGQMPITPPSGPLGPLARLVPSLFHDISNRLTPVLLESRLMLEASVDPHQAGRAAKLVQAVDGLQEVLDPVLVLLNPPLFQPVPSQLNKLVEDAAAEVKPWAQTRGATLELTLDAEIPECALDRTLVHHALRHLLENGLDRLQEGGLKRLRLATRRTDDMLQVLVQDTGPALSEAQRAKLFDAEAAGSIHGLVLPAVQALARQHKGQVTVRSQEGLGNAFLLELPLTPVSAPSAPPTKLDGARALLVDDEAFLLECVAEALQGWGMQVVTCTHAQEAMNRLEVDPFDVVLSDIRMPGLTGLDLYQWLKGTRPDLTSRVLFTTGDVFDAQTQAFLQTDKVPHLVKPFDLRQLRESLERLLQNPVRQD